MERNKTIYIGTMYQTAEYIFHSEKFELFGIICEKNRVSEELFTFALVRGIKLIEIISRNELLTVLQEYGSGYTYIMHSFGLRIPMEKLQGYNIYNIHPSELPKYKGAQPTYWATVKNEKKIGISMFRITENFDDGEIVAQSTVPYYIWENERSLFEKLEQVIPDFLEKLDESIRSGNEFLYKNCPGDYYPKVTRREVYIDLEKDLPDVIYNKVRAEAVFGGAKLCLEDVTYCLYKIVFVRGNIGKSAIINTKEILIPYRDEIYIKALEYTILEGEFKFRDEK